jgi:hypothetical protein
MTDDFNVSNGWLAPDGVLHRCDSWGHSELCVKLGNLHNIKNANYEDIMKLGYIQLRWWQFLVYGHGRVTQRQFDTMWEYEQRQKEHVDHFSIPVLDPNSGFKSLSELEIK